MNKIKKNIIFFIKHFMVVEFLAVLQYTLKYFHI